MTGHDAFARSGGAASRPNFARGPELARKTSELPEWECPGLSVHPGRVAPGHVQLFWQEIVPGRLRVIEYTCACQAVCFELVAGGGTYLIHRFLQSEPEQH